MGGIGSGGRGSAMKDRFSFHEWVSGQSSRLSQGETRLATHLVEHLDLWAFESAAQLAARLGVHRSTVVRFAKNLGMDGFPALQEKARSALLTAFSPSSQRRSGKVQADPLEEIYQREQMNLRQTFERMDLKILDAVARDIAGARRLFLFGRRFSYPIALYLSLALNTMRGDVWLAPEPGGTVIDALFDLTEADLALIVSLRRHSPEVQRTIEYLGEAKVPRVLLTDVSIGVDRVPGMRVLQANVGSSSLLDSYTALTSVGHTLLSLVSRHIPGCEMRLEAVERAWNRFNHQGPQIRSQR